MKKILQIYNKLYQTYGPQGWWPITNYSGSNTSKMGSTKGYHISDYSFPRNIDEVFEVCLGSILTQNTTFTSVEKSLDNLNKLGALTPQKINSLPEDIFKQAITPSGYHNQKARYIRAFIDFFKNLNGRTPSRAELLKQIGIGPETADSILLYGYNQPQLKVDAYTKRLFTELGYISEKASYHEIKELLESALQKEIKETQNLIVTYQEFHALIVNHGKQFYSRKPYGQNCFILAEYRA